MMPRQFKGRNGEVSETSVPKPKGDPGMSGSDMSAMQGKKSMMQKMTHLGPTTRLGPYHHLHGDTHAIL